MIAASSEGIEASERRVWTLSHAAAYMVMQASEERIEDLKDIGRTLVERARSIIEQEREIHTIDDEASNGEEIGLKLSASDFGRVASNVTIITSSRLQMPSTSRSCLRKKSVALCKMIAKTWILSPRNCGSYLANTLSPAKDTLKPATPTN